MMRTPSLALTILLLLALPCIAPPAALAQYGADEDAAEQTGQAAQIQDHDHSEPGHVHTPAAPELDFLSDRSRAALRALTIQDFQGRMKPLDTLSREMVIKITKRSHFQGWDPIDLYLSWFSDASYWYNQPLIFVKDPQIKQFLGVDPETRRVSAASLLDERGQYRLAGEVEESHRTDDRNRSKYQRHLLAFDERVNLFFMCLQQGTLRVYPLPGDPKNTWLTIEGVAEKLSGNPIGDYMAANQKLVEGLQGRDDAKIMAAAADHIRLQESYGSAVLFGGIAQKCELLLNRFNPFQQLIFPYLIAALLLLVAYIGTLAKRQGQPYSRKHPFYLIGSIFFWLTLLAHGTSFAMRWIASGRAPLSNGYESLIWISFMVGVAGFIFELRDRKGIAAGLASMLTAIILSVAMMSAFNPAIGPLVPVLASRWLIIHVTVITSSYGFLTLSALLALTMLILFFFKGPNRTTVQAAIGTLYNLHWKVLLTGLGLLSIGTFLGGVWANESWGRYWGWDSKETWSLVTILVYSAVSHFRFIPALASPWAMAAGSFIAVWSVMMTYFGVNYFLSGLHSYAAGSAASVPGWVNISVLVTLGIIVASYIVDRTRSWQSGTPA